MIVCSKGRLDPNSSCRFCDGRVHRGDSDCGCSTTNKAVTSYASLCIPCSQALASLYDDTLVGTIHRTLVREADMRGRPSSDDY